MFLHETQDVFDQEIFTGDPNRKQITTSLQKQILVVQILKEKLFFLKESPSLIMILPMAMNCFLKDRIIDYQFHLRISAYWSNVNAHGIIR